MGFAVTNTGCARRRKTHLPSKNRVWGFRAPARFRIRKSASQLREVHLEIRITVTTSVSGVRYYGFRYYSPELGRWLSRDPIAEQGGNNLYRFVFNDPVDEIDAYGNETYIDDKGIVVCQTPTDSNIYQYSRGGWGPPAPVGKSYFADTLKIGDKVFVRNDKTTQFFDVALKAEPMWTVRAGLKLRSGGEFDLKRSWGYQPNDAFMLNGKYASMRDFGNALAGLIARIHRTEYDDFQRRAGGLHKYGLFGASVSTLGWEYGTDYLYGEEDVQYRMSVIGYYQLYGAYESWKRSKKSN